MSDAEGITLIVSVDSVNNGSKSVYVPGGASGLASRIALQKALLDHGYTIIRWSDKMERRRELNVTLASNKPGALRTALPSTIL